MAFKFVHLVPNPSFVMKKCIIPFALLAVFILSAFTFVTPPELKLTDGYSIRIKGKRVNGFFHKLNAQISFDETNLPASKVKLEVDVRSITTGNSLKSWHAKKRKWFNAKEFPAITFVSDKFQKAAKGYTVTGKLKMKGVEHDISVPFAYSNNIFFGTFYVKRSDYNVGPAKGMGKMVSDSIQIEFTIPVTK